MDVVSNINISNIVKIFTHITLQRQRYNRCPWTYVLDWRWSIRWGRHCRSQAWRSRHWSDRRKQERIRKVCNRYLRWVVISILTMFQKPYYRMAHPQARGGAVQGLQRRIQSTYTPRPHQCIWWARIGALDWRYRRNRRGWLEKAYRLPWIYWARWSYPMVLEGMDCYAKLALAAAFTN